MRLRKLKMALIGAFLVMAWPLVSFAHVHMERTAPADGAMLSASPQNVEVWFSGKVAAEWSQIKVIDASGIRVDTGELSNGDDPKHLSVGLKPLRAGDYDVKLNVISGDGHRVKGSFTFSVK